jgi:hypothetical protein
MIKVKNFNKRLPQFHNFCTTSLEGKYVSVYNPERRRIEKINKKVFFDKVLNNSIISLEDIELYLELDKDIRKIIKEKYFHKISKKNTETRNKLLNKNITKNYKHKINELSYNNNKLILDTWSQLPDNEIESSVYYTTDSDSNTSDSETTTTSL